VCNALKTLDLLCGGNLAGDLLRTASQTMRSQLLEPMPPLAMRLREATRPLPSVRSGSRARVDSARFACERILSGGVAAVSILAPRVDPGAIWCSPQSTGFLVDVLPERAVMGDAVVLGLRIYRRIGTPDAACIVRIGIDDRWVAAVVDVHHH
jgi:hypothetical protein